MPLLTPHVPNGLIDCMKDLAKEVLREKPENIYEFAAIHFEKLILQRDGSMDKGYETFTEFEAYFDGKQRFAVPSNYGFICHRAIKTQSQTKKSKSDIMASFQAMESINEEDVLAPIPTSAPTPATAPTQAPESVIPLEGTNILYEDEKYQKAIYVIQRFFRRYKAKKEHSSTMNTNTTTKQSLSAFTAAIIIQRTMQRLFSNKIKLKKDKEKDSGLSSATSIVSAAAATAAAVKVVHDDMDSVSEAASYTSSSTIQMLAEGQEGRENRLASGQSRQEEREEGLDDDVDCNGNVDVDGAADFSSLVFKEPSQDGEPPSSPATAVVSVDNGDDEEHSHSVASAAVTVTEVDRKSIAVENENTSAIPEEEPIHLATSASDDTSTAQTIGILSTKIGSNYNHQNLNNTNRIKREQTAQINDTSQPNIAPAGLSVPFNTLSQKSLLGPTPDVSSSAATSITEKELQKTIQVHHLERPENANGNYKNNDETSYYQGGDGRIRKFDSETGGELLKIYDVYLHQDGTDQEFSDSLNESTMEKDSLEPEELDSDSLESNENVVHHMSDNLKIDTAQDDGSLYGDKNDNEVEGDGDEGGIEDSNENVHKLIEIERVPTYLYGIHPTRTPVVERRNRNRNSEESPKVPDDKKCVETAAISEVGSRSPEEKSEEESLESKASTSGESSATQIENNTNILNVKSENKDEIPMKSQNTQGNFLENEYSNALRDLGEARNLNETNQTALENENESFNRDLKIETSSNGTAPVVISEDSKKPENTDADCSEKTEEHKAKEKSNIIEEKSTKIVKINPASKKEEHDLKSESMNPEENVEETFKNNNLVKLDSQQIKEDKTASEKFLASERKIAEKRIELPTRKGELEELVSSTKCEEKNPNANHSLTEDDSKTLLKSKTSISHSEKVSQVDSNSIHGYKSEGIESSACTKDIVKENSGKSYVNNGHTAQITDSTLNLENSRSGGTSSVPDDIELNQSINSQHGEDDRILDHDQELESQFQKLRNLNDLASLEHDDTKTEELSRNKRSTDSGNYKTSQHDDNNNQEKEISCHKSQEYEEKDIDLHKIPMLDEPSKESGKNRTAIEAIDQNVTPISSESSKSLEISGKQNEDNDKADIKTNDNTSVLSNKILDQENSSSKTKGEEEIMNNSSETGSLEVDKDKIEKRPDTFSESKKLSLPSANSTTAEKTVEGIEIIDKSDKNAKKEITYPNSESELTTKVEDAKESSVEEISVNTSSTIRNLNSNQSIESSNKSSEKEQKSIQFSETNEHSSDIKTKEETIKHSFASESFLSNERIISNASPKTIQNITESVKKIDEKKLLQQSPSESMTHKTEKSLETVKTENGNSNQTDKHQHKEESQYLSTEIKTTTKSEELKQEKLKEKVLTEKKEISKIDSCEAEKLSETKSPQKLDNSRNDLVNDSEAVSESKNLVEPNNQEYEKMKLDEKQTPEETQTFKENQSNKEGTKSSTMLKNFNKEETTHLKNLDEEQQLGKETKTGTLEKEKELLLVSSSENPEIPSESANIVKTIRVSNEEPNLQEESKDKSKDSKNEKHDKEFNKKEEKSSDPQTISDDIEKTDKTVEDQHSSNEKSLNHEDLNQSENINSAGSSAETSADFSSIGKDLEFFEDTIKYLRNATEHLGELDAFNGNQKSVSNITKNSDLLNNSAVLIQNAFRGYQLRKNLKNEGKAEENPNNDDNKTKAAIKIQSAYRGHLIRKDLSSKSSDEKSKIQNLENLPSSSKAQNTVNQSIPKQILGNNLVKTQIPVAVIHPTSHSNSIEKGKATESKSTNSKSPSKQLHSKSKTLQQKPSVSTRNKSVKTANSDEKPSVGRSDQTFIRDTLDQTTKLDQTQILKNRKLSKSSGYGKSLQAKTQSTANLLERSKNVRDQFQKKGKSVSIHEGTENKESFDIEAIKKELLSTTFKSPPQSGSQKKPMRKVRSGKKKSPIKQSRATKIPQNSPSKTIKKEQIEEAQEPNNRTEEKPVTSEENDFSKTFIRETDQSEETEIKKHIEEAQQPVNEIKDKAVNSEENDLSKTFVRKKDQNEEIEIKKSSLNKTYTVQSSLNEMEHQNSLSEENLFDSLKKDVEKLRPNVQEKSAVTIQKTFRGFRTRKNFKNNKEDRLKTTGDVEENYKRTPEKVESDESSKNQSGNIKQEISGETPKVKENAIEVDESSKEINENIEAAQDQDLTKAATTIQKTFRGYNTRKQLKNKKKTSETDPLHEGDLNSKPKDEEENKERTGVFESLQKDIKDYKNSILDRSATTIQKHYKGYKVRKDLNTKFIKSGTENKTGESMELDTKEEKRGKQNNETLTTESHLKEEEVKEMKSLDPEISATTIQKNDFKSQANVQEIRTQGNEKVEEIKHTIEELETEPILRESNSNGTSRAPQQNSHSDLEKSAITIQKNFRGYRVRRRIKDEAVLTPAESKQSMTNTKEKQKLKTSQKLGVFDSFDVGAFHNEALQKSATVIQKTYRGYKTRKEFLGKKISSITQHALKSNTAEILDQDTIKDHAKANDSSKYSITPSEKIKDEAESKTEKPPEDKLSTENQSSTNEAESEQHEVIPSEDYDSNLQKSQTKSSSAEAVLENAATTIQKAYRHYHSKKNNNISRKSYSNGTHRSPTPKETIETSDESSTFIGPDTSFDLSDVDSVETKSDKMHSSESNTPTNDNKECLESTISVKVHSEDQEIDNECVNTPQKLRIKRSLIEPSAPPLDEILPAEEAPTASSKPKWFVGDDLIVPSDSNSSPSTPSSFPSSPVDPLIPSSSKSNNLGSIGACRDSLNSNQQLTSPLDTTVVSTSSLLLTNNTQKNDTLFLNKNSGIVSANKEDNLKIEENNLENTVQSEDLQSNFKKENQISSSTVVSNNELSSHSGSKDKETTESSEDKIEGCKEVVTDLCKNCAEGIHEGGICSQNLMRTSKNEKTDSADQMKQFVLMEELSKQSQFSEGEAKKADSSLTASNDTISDDKLSIEKLDSSKDCPAISLIPPSSEDDTSDRESIHHNIEEEKGGNKISGKEVVHFQDSKDQIEKESKEDIIKENVSGNEKAKTTSIDEDISAELISALTHSNEDKQISEEKVSDSRTNSLNEESVSNLQSSKEEEPQHVTKIEENSIEEEKHEISSNNTTSSNKGPSSAGGHIEDAFNTPIKEEDKVEEHGFEDDFIKSQVIEVSDDKEKEPPLEVSQKQTSLKEEEVEQLNKNNTQSKNIDNENKVINEQKDSKKKPPEEEDSITLDEKLKNSNEEKLGEEATKIEAEKQISTSQSLTEEETKNSNSSEVTELTENSEQKHTIDGTENTNASESLHENSSLPKQESPINTDQDMVNSSGSNEKHQEEEVSKEPASIPKTDKETQEDFEIAAKLIESSLSDPLAKLLENKYKEKLANGDMSTEIQEPISDSKTNDEPNPEIEAKLEKLIEENLKPSQEDKNIIDLKDLPTSNSSQEIVEEPCVKKVIPPTPYTANSDESELESTTTKDESSTTTPTPGCDETSEPEHIDIPPSKPDDALDALTEKLSEPDKMVARMQQRRASEHKLSLDSVTDQQAVFEEPICEPIKPMEKIQKNSSTEAEDEFVLQKLQRGETTRESSAQSESVVFGDSSSQLTESEDTFNENLHLHSLHRMNTIAANRGSFKPPTHLFKSVTIDDTVKYIDPEKSTEESGGSFCMDDALSEDVRKKMMAYSVSEADSDYFDGGDQLIHKHDDFNISTALDNFPSTDTDTTIVSAATKIQAGARGFLTRRRIRRASMGTKTSLVGDRNVSFGNEAIGESLDHLANDEVGKRQFNRQTGVNSLPSALEHSDKILSPSRHYDEEYQTTHSSIKTESNKATTSLGNDVNERREKPSEDDSSQSVSNLEATVARRLTLQRGDALRNDSTPDDENGNGNGNGKQVDLAKNNASSMGSVLGYEKTMVESTTTTTTRTTTERRNYSDAAVYKKKDSIKWLALRQNSMPVQIDSEVFRVLPKHMRKRIKSAEGEKPKRIRFPRD